MLRRLAVVVSIALGCAGSPRQLQLRSEEVPAPFREDAAETAAAFASDPNDAAVLYQLAANLTRAGRIDDALEALRRMAALGAGLDPRPRDGFAPLVANAEFQRIVAAIRKENPPVLRAREIFSIDEGDSLPEGIAWSKKTERFYLGNARRKIVAVDRRGHVEALLAEADERGLGAIVGLRVDEARGELWAASSQLNGKPKDALVGLVRIRLSDRTVLGRYPSGGGDLVNDVAVTPEGVAYATLTTAGQLLRVDPANQRIATVLAPSAISSANGIAVAPDGNALYVASWHDVYRVELPSLDVRPLPKPKNVASGCFDGLYVIGRDLVGIQNCVHATGRVVRLHLDPRGARIEGATVLESYNPLFDGITTAALADDALVFVANVQFRKMGTTERFDPLHVLALPLSP